MSACASANSSLPNASASSDSSLSSASASSDSSLSSASASANSSSPGAEEKFVNLMYNEQSLPKCDNVPSHSNMDRGSLDDQDVLAKDDLEEISTATILANLAAGGSSLEDISSSEESDLPVENWLGIREGHLPTNPVPPFSLNVAKMVVTLSGEAGACHSAPAILDTPPLLPPAVIQEVDSEDEGVEDDLSTDLQNL